MKHAEADRVHPWGRFSETVSKLHQLALSAAAHAYGV